MVFQDYRYFYQLEIPAVGNREAKFIMDGIRKNRPKNSFGNISRYLLIGTVL